MDDRPLSRRSMLLASAGASMRAARILSRSSRGTTRLSLTEKVSRLFVVSFNGLSVPDARFSALIERVPVGGVILYGRNCSAADQVRSLLSHVRSRSRFPLIVAVDQEGGTVERLQRGVHVFPAEAWYGAHSNPGRVYSDAAVTARELGSLGVTVNLAPVADVISDPRSPIGSRSFGTSPSLVAAMTEAAVRGYQAHGVASVVKHFVGLGHTSIDSHQSLPVVHQSLSQLARKDLIPFRAAIRSGVAGVLVAHVSLPDIDPSGRPASLSSPIIHGLLRGRLGFRGAVVTDSLAMNALAQESVDVAAEEALLAGADVLLIAAAKDIPSGTVEAAIERIVHGVRAGRISRERIDEALARAALLRPSV